jgi:hypothetical protein
MVDMAITANTDISLFGSSDRNIVYLQIINNE